MLFRFILFIDDGLGVALRENFKVSFSIFSPVLTCICLYLVMTTLPSYAEQRAVLILLVNYVISNISLSLMISTMTGKVFSNIVQPVIGLLIVPLVAYHGFGVAAETEILLRRAMTALALLFFIARLVIIAIQWGDYANTPFWIIQKPKRI